MANNQLGFEALAAELAQLWSEKQDIRSIKASKNFLGFLKSHAISDKIKDLEKSTISVDEMGSMTMLSGKASLIAINNGWMATLVKRTDLTRFVHAAPYPTIIVPMSENSAVTMGTFSLQKKYQSMDKLPSDLQITSVGDFEATKDNPFMSSSEVNSYGITNTTGNNIFLRLTGPSSGPYIHFFDINNLLYSHTAMAAQEFTSRYFYAEALKNIIYSIDMDSLSESEQSSLINFMQDKIDTDTDMPHECWSLIQALFVLDDMKAITVLKEFSAHQGPLQPNAEKALLRLS